MKILLGIIAVSMVMAFIQYSGSESHSDASPAFERETKTVDTEGAICFKDFSEAMLFVSAARNKDTAGAFAIQSRNSELASGTKVTTLLRDPPFEVVYVDSGASIGKSCHVLPNELK